MPKFKETVFLCGPISGYLNVDWQMYVEYENIMIMLGFEVMNPLRVCMSMRNETEIAKMQTDWPLGPKKWNQMYDIDAVRSRMADCEAILLIPGWDESIISSIYVLTARLLGLKSYTIINGELRNFSRNDDVAPYYEIQQADQAGHDEDQNGYLDQLDGHDPSKVFDADYNPIKDAGVSAQDRSSVDDVGDWFTKQMG